MSGAARADGVRVDVLGAVAASSNGRTIAGHALGGRRARVALVALALADGPLSAERLASMIWADHPPATWPAALRGVVGALRTSLAGVGAGGQRIIATVPSGYCLAPGVAVDLHLAAAALRTAAMLADQGRYEAALDAAEPAVRLSGEQLLPGEDAIWLDPYRRELDAAALRALELLARAAGALGDHHRATEAGRRAVAGSPLNERSHRLLIRALHLAGDRSGVVRAYEECRVLLADQLGVDPDPETVDAYLSALGQAGTGGAARLPLAASAFFGRETEAARLATAIRQPGLVTVTGKGGVGKSRLALHVAAPSGYFTGGKMWISLASVAQDELVASTVAVTLGLPLGAEDATSLLTDHLAPVGRALLVLDGCEAVIDGVASLVTGLLSFCHLLSIVVTSRVPLSVDTERVMHLEPLQWPTEGSWPELMASSPVQLLTDRVRGGGGRLEIDSEIAPLVAELCRRCGGLPLALELAAAQLTAMSVADLLDHLPGLIADGEDRLRSVARSSYALLAEDEATVFRRFGVLDGHATLPLVRDVVAGGTITPVRVVRILRELTARGLLAVDRSGARWRYQQDDDLHRLARELLAEAGEEIPALNRLFDAVCGIIPDDPRAAPTPHLDTIGEVLPEIRSLLGAAIDGLLARDRGLELSFRLHRYWAASNVAEGRFWLSRLLAAVPPSTWTAHAAYALGYLSYWSGDVGAAVGELQTAVEMLRDQPDEYVARALIYLGGLADDMDRGEEALDFVRRSMAAAAPFGVDLQVGAAIGMGCVLAERADRRAADFAAEAIELCRNDGSAEQLASTLPTAAMVCWQVGDLETARRYVAEAMPLLADSRRIARVVLLSAAAGVALADRDLDTAIELGTIAEADASSLGIERELPLLRSLLARAMLDQGDVEAAARQARGAVMAARSLSFTFPLAVCLETAALVCLARPDDGQTAGPLLTAAAAIRQRGNRPGPPTLRAAVHQARAAVARLGQQADAPAADLDATVALAVTVLRPASQHPADVGTACR
jgi:predicted ATPase/DNA-binding SARP family transcriptional activator